MELSYTKVGDYLLPNLTIEKQNSEKINKYGYLRLHYLMKNNKPLYTTLLMQNELTNHLVSVSSEAENRLNILMEQYKNSDKLLSEKNKMDNQLEWVKRMNNYKNIATSPIPQKKADDSEKFFNFDIRRIVLATLASGYTYITAFLFLSLLTGYIINKKDFYKTQSEFGKLIDDESQVQLKNIQHSLKNNIIINCGYFMPFLLKI